jgi:hypothetical protein
MTVLEAAKPKMLSGQKVINDFSKAHLNCRKKL